MSRDIHNKFWDEELETLPREELEKRQLADLQEIVKFAYENAPYYKLSTRKPSATRRAWAPFWVSLRLSPRRTWCSFPPRPVQPEFPP